MKKIVINLFILFISFFVLSNFVSASTYNVSVGKTSLTKGQSTKLTIKTNDLYGRFNITTSNAGVVAISSDRLWVNNNDSASLNLEALSTGTATITIKPIDVANSNGDTTIGSKSITIKVVEKQTTNNNSNNKTNNNQTPVQREKSSDNTLKSLSIEGFDLTPEFNKDVTDYSISVPETTKNIVLKATANDNKSHISGTGEKEVVEGANYFSVVVKAENGNEKTYNVLVNVIDEHPIKVTLNDVDYTVIKLRDSYKCPELFEESNVEVSSINVPACYNDKIKYTLVGLKNEKGEVIDAIYENGNYVIFKKLTSSVLKIIPLNYNNNLDGYIKVSEKINDETYNVFKYDKKSRYSIIYGMNVETGVKDFYLYDKDSNAFMLHDSKYINNLINKNKSFIYVIIAFGIALLLSLVGLLFSLKRNTKSKIEKEVIETKKEEVIEDDFENILDDNKKKRKKKVQKDK